MKKFFALLFIFLMFLPLKACWNNVEINELGFTVAIGVDMIENDLIELTVQIIVPRFLAMDGTDINATATYSHTGDTAFEALRNIARISSRRAYINHIQLIIIGESLATYGIQNVVDFFERDHEFRRQAVLIQSRDISAKEILELQSIFEIIPALHILEIIKNNVLVSKSKELSLIQGIEELNSDGNHLVIGNIAPRKKNQNLQFIRDLNLEGASVFNGDKLAGYLDVEETRGYLWVVGTVEGGILAIPSPINPRKFISMEIIRSNSKMDVRLEENELVLIVEVEEAGIIGEQQSIVNHSTPDQLEILEQKKEQLIREEIKKAFDKAQNVYELDFFGFGEIIHRKHPKLWHEIKDDWDIIFSNCKVEIKVTTEVHGTGQVLKPTSPR